MEDPLLPKDMKGQIPGGGRLRPLLSAGVSATNRAPGRIIKAIRQGMVLQEIDLRMVAGRWSPAHISEEFPDNSEMGLSRWELHSTDDRQIWKLPVLLAPNRFW